MEITFVVEPRKDDPTLDVKPYLTEEVKAVLAEADLDVTPLVLHTDDLDEFAALLELDEIELGTIYAVDLEVFADVCNQWLFDTLYFDPDDSYDDDLDFTDFDYDDWDPDDEADDGYDWLPDWDNTEEIEW